MEPSMIVLTAVGVVLLLVGVWYIATFNRFVRLRQQISESWADVDVELKRRYDLIPNLVATVRGYAAHERDVLQRVVELRDRAAANHGAPDSQASDETALMLGVRQLFAVVEAYPQLKADRQFLALQQELAMTEDRIAAARRFYNGNVRELNAMCQTFPASMVAGMARAQPQPFFELSSDAERVVPRVAIPTQTQPL
jgi:LemA protein